MGPGHAEPVELAQIDILLIHPVFQTMRPPLTREDLIAIQARNKGDEDVAALLWEIKRLRVLVLKSHDYFRQSPMSSTGRAMAESMLEQLEQGPAVKEQPKL